MWPIATIPIYWLRFKLGYGLYVFNCIKRLIINIRSDYNNEKKKFSIGSIIDTIAGSAACGM